MLFNSYIFILSFLPLTLVGYFLLSHINRFKLANEYLLCMSLCFYAYFNIHYLPIIICSLVFNYLTKMLLDKDFPSWVRKFILIISVTCNFAALFYFKYFDFFLANINAIFSTDYSLKHLLLPLGISFFTFQQVSFL